MADVTDIEEGPLEKEGWTKRSILDEPRLCEVAETYRALGLEVKLVPIDPETVNGCTTCLECDGGRYRIVYTRPGEGAREDLFD